MKKYIMAGILLAATMLVSCGGLQPFTFDQLYPAEVTFPEHWADWKEMGRFCRKVWLEDWLIVVISIR